MNDEDILLRSLPSPDLAPERAERIRRRAHAILRAERTAPNAGGLARHYRRTLEPVLLLGLAFAQAAWAVHGTWLVLR